MTLRGSRKHVLDWVQQPRFLPELLALALPADCRVTAMSKWAPISRENAAEARLDIFGEQAIPAHPAWPALRTWWLKHEQGANTPNWDIALCCEVDGRPGLVLVEAKANEPELSTSGKRSELTASAASQANHDRIGEAIAEACASLEPQFPGIAISRDTHYQLSNRIAFAWRLASLGVPTVLIYLGFTGDAGIANVGMPFSDDAHWQHVFTNHLTAVCPCSIAERAIDCGAASFWLLSRSRHVLELSPAVI